MRLSQRVRARLRDEFTHRKISQRVVAARLTRNTGEVWTQSKVHKILTGQVQLLADDMVLLISEAGLNLVDVVREPGRELVADLTPTELKLINLWRDNPRVLQAIQGMADVMIQQTPKRKPGRRTIRERMADPEG